MLVSHRPVLIIPLALNLELDNHVGRQQVYELNHFVANTAAKGVKQEDKDHQAHDSQMFYGFHKLLQRPWRKSIQQALAVQRRPRDGVENK